MITVPAGARIYLACGLTDVRRTGLSLPSRNSRRPPLQGRAADHFRLLERPWSSCERISFATT
jgi:hypothetical protein